MFLQPRLEVLLGPDRQIALTQSSRDKVAWAASAAKTRVAQQFAATVPGQGGNLARTGAALEAPSNKAAEALSPGASAPICNR